MNTVVFKNFIIFGISVLTGCGGRHFFSSKNTASTGAPTAQPTVLPPVPVIGSYLNSVLVDENLKPITKTEILADSGLLSIKSDDKGIFTLPLSYFRNNKLDLDVKTDGKIIFLSVTLPSDIATAIQGIDSGAGIAAQRLLGISVEQIFIQGTGTPEKRINATTWSIPAEKLKTLQPYSPVANLRVTSHKGGEIVGPIFNLKGECEDGHKISLSGDVIANYEGRCNTPQNSGSPSFEFSLSLKDSEGPKTVMVTQTEPTNGEYIAQQLIFDFKLPLLAPALTPASVIGLRAALTGTCDSSATAHSASTNLGSIRSVDCINGKLTVIAHLPAGVISTAPSDGKTFSVTVNSVKDGNSKSSDAVTYTRVGFDCPAGYIGIPGSGIAGLGNTSATDSHANWWLNTSKDFCVMKYPAKNNNGSTFATSTIAGTPWVNIQRGADESTPNSAFTACKSAGAEYRLISNTQWQTVARNAEGVAENWSGNVIGSGVIARGHSDGIPAGAIENANDDNPYFLTQNTGGEWNTLGAAPVDGAEQRRTHILSNGEIIWDLSGNVYQWVSDNKDELGIPEVDNIGLSLKSWHTYLNGVTNRYTQTTNLIFGSSGISSLQLSESQNAGQLYGGTEGTVLRSGFWNIARAGGIYSVVLNNLPIANNGLVGFRCVYLPQ
jgi:hypothetical protein